MAINWFLMCFPFLWHHSFGIRSWQEWLAIASRLELESLRFDLRFSSCFPYLAAVIRAFWATPLGNASIIVLAFRYKTLYRFFFYSCSLDSLNTLFARSDTWDTFAGHHLFVLCNQVPRCLGLECTLVFAPLKFHFLSGFIVLTSFQLHILTKFI
jgi:hypothetical protein